MQKKFPLCARLDALAIAAMAALLTYVLWEVWSTRLDYAFGYLMPMFMAYVVWDRLPKIEKYFASEPSERGGKFAELFFGALFGAMAVCGFATFLMFSIVYSVVKGGTVAPLFCLSFSFAFAFYGLAYFAGSENLAGEKMAVCDRLRFANFFVFPAFAWMIASPFFAAWENLISRFLLTKVAIIVTAVMDSAGFMVELRGNSIFFPYGAVGVADACSGIRSLTACLFSGSFLAAVFLDKMWKKVALVAMSMVLAFINNIIRALFLSVWAYKFGSDSISGFVHDAAGYAVLGLTVVGLLILIPLFSLNPIPKELRGESGDLESDDSETDGQESNEEEPPQETK